MLNGHISNDLKIMNGALGLRLAVKRNFKNAEGGYDTDFISCNAFGKQAEFIQKYFKKGSGILIIGTLQNNNYEKDGKKVYTDRVIINEVEFDGRESNTTNPYTTPSQDVKEMELEDLGFVDDKKEVVKTSAGSISEDDLPF